MKTTIVSANNQLGSYDEPHKNIIEIKECTVLEFQGNTIPGIIRVISEDCIGEGVQSYYTWTCELMSKCKLITLTQNWKTGRWLISRTWNEVAKELREKGFTAPAKNIVRKLFPMTAEVLDNEEIVWKSNTFEDIFTFLKDEAQFREDEAQIFQQGRTQNKSNLLILKNMKNQEKLEFLRNQNPKIYKDELKY